MVSTGSNKEDNVEEGQGVLRVVAIKTEGVAIPDKFEQNPPKHDNVLPKKKKKTKSFSKAFSIAKPELPMVFVSLLFQITGEGVRLFIPLQLAKAFDALIYSSEDETSSEIMGSINNTMLIVLGLSITSIFVTFLRNLIQQIIGERVVSRIRCQLYTSILRQEIAFFDEHKTGELISRLGSDTTLLQSVISTNVPDFLTGFIQSVTAITLMFVISFKLAGMALGGVLVILVMATPLGITLGKLSKEYQNELSEAQTHSAEAFGSIRTVQAFAAEKKEIERFEKKIGNPDQYTLCPSLWWPVMNEGDVKSTYRAGYFKALVSSSTFNLSFGLAFGYLNVILWYGFYLIHFGEMSVGELTAFQSFVFNVGFGLGLIAGNMVRMIEGIKANDRVFELLDRIPQIPTPPMSDGIVSEKSLTPASMIGNIEFQNVNFAYSSRPEVLVLNDFTLKIPNNSTTGMKYTILLYFALFIRSFLYLLNDYQLTHFLEILLIILSSPSWIKWCW